MCFSLFCLSLLSFFPGQNGHDPKFRPQTTNLCEIFGTAKKSNWAESNWSKSSAPTFEAASFCQLFLCTDGLPVVLPQRCPPVAGAQISHVAKALARRGEVRHAQTLSSCLCAEAMKWLDHVLPEVGTCCPTEQQEPRCLEDLHCGDSLKRLLGLRNQLINVERVASRSSQNAQPILRQEATQDHSSAPLRRDPTSALQQCAPQPGGLRSTRHGES